VNATSGEPVCLKLAPTKTRWKRRLVWLPGVGSERDGRLGTLRIVQEAAKRPGDSTECDQYGIDFAPPDETPVGTVAFMVLNDADPKVEGEDRPEIYKVVFNLVGTAAGCECKANAARGYECKHISSLRALRDAGHLGGSQ
jgi:hypothetical protein